jgi:hypothetical protein
VDKGSTANRPGRLHEPDECAQSFIKTMRNASSVPTIDAAGRRAGRIVWHGRNVGNQPHFLTFVRTPELVTVEHVQAILTLPEGGTPPPGVPDPATVDVLPYELRNLSPGREIWIELDLIPGFYAALCALPDPATGQPHALLGEVDIFTVGEPGTPAA